MLHLVIVERNDFLVTTVLMIGHRCIFKKQLQCTNDSPMGSLLNRSGTSACQFFFCSQVSNLTQVCLNKESINFVNLLKDNQCNGDLP